MLIAFEIILLTAHLVCMNVASGGPLVALWLEWKDRRGDAVAPQAARYLATAAILALLVGSLLGLLIGWLKWTPEYAEIWQVRLWNKVKWGLGELAVSAVLLIGYWFWRKRATLPTRRGYIGRSLLLLITSTNLLYHFPTLLMVGSKLAEGSFPSDVDIPAGTLTARQFRPLLLHDEIPALSVHFGLASVAMAGVTLFGLALRRLRSDEDPRGAHRIIAWGGWSALVATGLQLVVGLWLLVTTPPDMQSQLIGSSLLATGCFVGSLILVVWLLRELADVTIGEPTRGGLIRSMIAMTAIVLLMTAARQLSRPTLPAKTPGVNQSELSTRAAMSPIHASIPSHHRPTLRTTT